MYVLNYISSISSKFMSYRSCTLTAVVVGCPASECPVVVVTETEYTRLIESEFIWTCSALFDDKLS